MKKLELSSGQFSENVAAKLYIKYNFKILVRNFYNHYGKRVGEIDFVALKNKHLHFVEVKARAENSFVSPEEALTAAKKLKIIKAAKYFLARFPDFLECTIR